ncbi:MAG: calcium/sodium antiporter [Xanthomonadales bacterium]|nr:calcium/sodium antiporter [Xanthomonadales bacterium]
MLLTLLFFVIGLVLVIYGADLLISGASKLALTFGVSPLVVGLTVVAFGTSAPELAVSVKAAWVGEVDVSTGNVIGSNIVNVLLILGLSALIAPLIVDRMLIRRDLPVMISAALLLWLLAADGRIGFWDGALFFTLLIGYVALLYRTGRDFSEDLEADDEIEDVTAPAVSRRRRAVWKQAGLVIAGVALMVMGANWLVDGAVAIAVWLGVSELIIGLTIVAIGTSLPEAATSITASIRGQRDIAIGNVVGITLLCLPLFYTGNLLARWEGGLLFGLYLLYVSWLVLSTRHSTVQDEFLAVVGWGVLPLLLALVLTSLYTDRRRRIHTALHAG